MKSREEGQGQEAERLVVVVSRDETMRRKGKEEKDLEIIIQGQGTISPQHMVSCQGPNGPG